jgi:hypothetical protein
MSKWKLLVAAGLIAFAGVACNGEDDDDGNGGNGGEDVSVDSSMPDVMPDMSGCGVDNTVALEGAASVHPLSQALAGGGQNLSGVEMRVQLALSALSADFETIRQTGGCEDAIFTTASDLMMPQSTFSFPDGIDASGVTFGIVATTDDAGDFGTGSSGDWVPTVTGLMGSSPADTTDAQAFAMTSSAEQSLADLIGPEDDNISGDPGSLAAQGPAVVLFLDDSGQPAEGVQLFTASEAQAQIDNSNGTAYGSAYYPDGTFSSVAVGANGSTAAHGNMIATGLSSQTEYTGLKLDGDGNVTAQYTTQRGGSVNGVFYTVVLTEQTGGS